MSLFEEYDKQLVDYTKETAAMNLPLLSWDFHLNNLNNVAKEVYDVNLINKLTKKLIVGVDIIEEYTKNSKVIVITNPDLEIEFASSNIVEMTGYLSSEVIGNSPKMFQGPNTDVVISKDIRVHVNESKAFEATLTNYRKDNSEYECHIKGYPIFNKKGVLVKFVALEQEAA